VDTAQKDVQEQDRVLGEMSLDKTNPAQQAKTTPMKHKSATTQTPPPVVLAKKGTIHIVRPSTFLSQY
jgi:hypothetical protein